MKKIVFGLIAVCSLFTLVACKSSSTKDLQSKIKEKGKLVVALSPDYAPFEFKALVDGKDKVVGSDVELAQNIADELGVTLEISTMNFENVLASLQSRKADIAISGLSYSKERAKVFDFSDSYYDAKNAILIRASDSSKYQSLNQLSGKKVAVLKGSIEENLSKEQLKDSHIVSLTSMSEVITELKSGKVDAVDLEGPVGQGYISQNSDLAMASFALKTSDEDAKAIVLPKNNRSLQKTINQVIKKIKKDNKYQEFIDKASALTSSQLSE